MSETILEPVRFDITRTDLRRYADASGDHNSIHLDEQVAKSVGLPGVIAHGMYTMALVGRAVEGWAGPGSVVELGGKFVKPVVVPADGAATVEVSGTMSAPVDGQAKLKLVVTCAGEKVLGMPTAVVRV